MARLAGKVALVSGGARGLGAAIVEAYVREGAKVVFGDILPEEGKALEAKLGSDAVYVDLDVTDYAQWEAAVAVAKDKFGGLSILVNNAGIVIFGGIEDCTLEDWHKVVQVNLDGVFYGMKAAVPVMKESTPGSIINLSSTAGLQGYEALPSYNATKFAVRGLTKNVALDLGKYNIRCNSIHPGLITTPMTENLDAPQNHVALHRAGVPREIADLAIYLGSDESSFSTGAEFVADGGETAGLAHY